VPLYVAIAFITGPVIEAEVDSFNVGAPMPASVVKSLVAGGYLRRRGVVPGLTNSTTEH
jgi:hypothetical protein